MQMHLSLKPEMMPIDDALIAAQGSMTRALVLCQQASGLDDKQLVGKGGVVEHLAQWSRIKNGQHHFPQDALGRFMDCCGNEAPLLWLARSRGYALVPLETEMERRLRMEREARAKAEAENSLLREMLIGRGRH